MDGPIQEGLHLIPRILSKFTIDIVYKGLILFKVYLEETFEFRLSGQYFFCKGTLILVPSLSHHTMQKQGGKKDVVGPISFGGFKVVCTLLTKSVAIQEKILIIEVEELSFQRLLLKLYLNWNGR